MNANKTGYGSAEGEGGRRESKNYAIKPEIPLYLA